MKTRPSQKNKGNEMAWCFQEILNPWKQWLKTANSFQVLTLKYIYSTKCLICSNSFKKAEHQRIDAFGVGEDSWQSLGLQGDLSSPS